MPGFPSSATPAHSMSMIRPCLATVLLACPGWGQGELPREPVTRSEQPSPSAPVTLTWDARAAEHLWNRAAFGASSRRIDQLVELGPEVCLEILLGETQRDPTTYFAHPPRPRKSDLEGLSESERKQLKDDYRRRDRRQMVDYGRRWIEDMVAGKDPLRDRMTLLWHGHFTSSYREVRSSLAMIRQHEFLRAHALGSFRTLLGGILRDAAMLSYLDGDKNTVDSPNENLARELLELFALGEGNYGEQDVREVARALTGWRRRSGRVEFDRKRADLGDKTILGVTGPHDLDSLVEVLLDHPACARHVAGLILTSFEGVAPGEDRLQGYSDLLRRSDWELEPFVRALLRDPAFYRDEIVGQRVAGPIEYLVGASRRLGVDAPPMLLQLASSVLGQTLFQPPNVKGWDEGFAWLTSSNLQQRGNMAGMLLGVVDVTDILTSHEQGEARDSMMEEGISMGSEMAGAGDEPGESMGAPGKSKPSKAFRYLADVEELGWAPRIHLVERMRGLGLRRDGEMGDELLSDLLAVPASRTSRRVVRRHLESERERLGLRNGDLLGQPIDAEGVLRRTAHVILSLPEAHLH